MSSDSTYATLRDAIQHGRTLAVTYHGKHRRICPYVLGNTRGERRLVAYQYAGGSVSGLPWAGGWRHFLVQQLRGVAVLNDPWVDVDPTSTPQNYILSVDVARPGFERVTMDAAGLVTMQGSG